MLPRRIILLPLIALAAVFVVAVADPASNPSFRAGAHVVDISPAKFPVIVNAMFTERSASRTVDPLHARALALDDGATRFVFCVVDTCMMPRDLIERATSAASAATGVPADHMLVCATHTHSAPSAMGCLGSRVDPEYAGMLPGKIAEAIIGAVKNLQPAHIGWTAVDDWDHTFNRRWIRRPDRLLNDPFGRPNVRANMHPGYESPDVTGPSGPVDPQFSMLAVQSPDGRPIALLANYSMHYYGSDLLSSDYFGKFARHVAGSIGAAEGFVGMLTQGTSGDLMWMDYSAPAKNIGYDAYAKEIAQRAADAYRNIQWHDSAPLKSARRALTLNYRVPDEQRLARSREVAGKLGGRLPQTQEEIYSLEATALHERQKTELALQAVRVGDFGITAIPNEVFALTGLKLKAQSPFATTMNIELANGAEGYIPPPEQHALGGYTTWPARTAGLEVQAEPKIVEALLSLMEKVTGLSRRIPVADANYGEYARSVWNAKPQAWWRLEEMAGVLASDSSGHGRDGTLEGGFAWFLPGADGTIGHQSRPAAPNAFSGEEFNRAVHFAGGRMRASLPLDRDYSIELWLWNGLPSDARPITGYLISRGPDGDEAARGEHLGIAGTYRGEDGTGPDLRGRLFLFNGNERKQILAGRTPLALRAWHHVVFVREGGNVRVHLDGRAEPEISGAFAHTVPAGDQSFFVGGRNDGLFNFEGKLDEIAVHARALKPEEIGAHYKASGLKPPVPAVAAAVVPPAPESPPLSPLESMKKIHVTNGYGFELVASEPLIADPVAIDWDLAGRLWVVEMADYPMGIDGKGKPGGRVRVLDDIDGDGRYDKSTLFADGLNFPTGLLTWRDGVIVTAAPDVLFLKDTNGDGKADTTMKLLTGLGEGNQQLRANGLRWGLDNFVYCAAGGHHGGHAADTVLRSHRLSAGMDANGNEKWGVDVKIGSRDFGFDPDTGVLFPESGPSQFGRNRDDAGHWFGTQNSRALWHYVLPDHYLKRNPHVPSPDPTHLIVTPLNAPVYPVSPAEKRFHSFENAGHFTSACSGMIYRDELLFPRRDNELDAFTCEPFHNLVQHNILVEDGVTWKARRASGEEKHEFFASEDRWCRPVMTRTGPDGALWVVDMYRYMIEHPDWLPENGRAELLPHYRLGEDKGRIYRVFRTDQPPRKVQRLDKLSPVELVKALDSPNEWQRDKVHMALNWWTYSKEGANNYQEFDLARSALSKLHDSPRALTRLQAMCIACFDHYWPGRWLTDKSPIVRENAVSKLRTIDHKEVLDSYIALSRDTHPRVRLEFALKAGQQLPGADKAPKFGKVGEALVKLAIRDHSDPWMRAAVMSSAVPHCRALCQGIAAAGGAAFAAYADDLIALALALEDRVALTAVLKPSLTPSHGRYSDEQMNSFARLIDMLERKKVTLAKLAGEADALGDCLRMAKDIFSQANQDAVNNSAKPEFRTAAAALLCRDANERPAALQLLGEWLAPTRDSALQLGAVRTLAATGDQSVPAALLKDWPSHSPATRAAAIEALLSREAWGIAMLEHAQRGGALVLDAVQRARLLQHGAKRVRELAAKVLTGGSSRKESLEQFRPALKLSGDPARGKTVFMTRCIACHRLDGLGIELGPELKSVIDHPPEKLLTNIIDPNVDVQPGFHAYHCLLSDGSELYGLIASESGSSITLKLADGTSRAVLRRDIKALTGAKASLMPEGLEAGMSTQDMADLIALLRAGSGAAPAKSTPATASGELRVGAAAINLQSDDTMPLAGSLESRFTKEQEGELRAVAVVIEKPGAGKVAIVACDVLWVTRSIVDPAVAEIERSTGIPAAHILVNATHTHSAPGTAPAHLFGWSEKFADEVRRGIVRSVQDANARLADAGLFFHLGEERTVGANSRLLLRDGSISWLNPAGEAGLRVEPTGPFDPQLPVLDFRAPDGKTRALLYNHSTHTIGTRSGRDVRSPSFYGLAAQELEAELGGVVEFIEGASGSTHNIRGVPVPLAIERMKRAVLDARTQAAPRPVARVAALKRPFSYRVRTFDEATEDAKVVRYAETYAKANAARIREIFAGARRVIGPKSGEERTTWLQAMVIGDVAFVGVPAEYFTVLGLDIKRRSPFKHTYVAELANDWIGYLPDKDGHARGGYQTWTGLHSYAEQGTGELMADEAVKMLGELAAAVR